MVQCHMLVSLKNRMILVENTETGDKIPLLLEFDNEGNLIVSDAGTDIPRFEYRSKLDLFPSDEILCAHIGKMLGGSFVIAETLDRIVELESSALNGLKKMPVDIFDRVYLDEVKNDALVLCVDIRSFSDFLCSNAEDTVFSLIKDFTSNFLSCVNQIACGCSYYKLLGDGALIIWDATTPQSVSEALSVFDTYIEFVHDELFKPYPGLGFAGALVTEKVFKYEISAEASQLKYRDYVGYGINLSCRLQGLAARDELIINRNLAHTGFVPYRTTVSKAYLRELRLLKGLKDEDCGELFFYEPDRAKPGTGI